MIRLIALICLLYSSSTSYAQDSLLIDDNFDDNSLEWYVVENNSLKIKVQDGHYYIKNKNNNSQRLHRVLGSLNPNKEDFTVEVRLRQIAGGMGLGYGLFVGLTANSQAYKKFLINGSGQFKLDDFFNNRSHLLADYKDEKALNKLFEYNVLKVEKNAQIISYSINGKVIGNSINRGKYGNRVAFFLGGKMSLEIDYIKISKRPLGINLVENAGQERTRTKLDTTINSKYDELSPILSADGKTMYICRYNHPENVAKGSDIWVTQLLKNKEWSALKNIGRPLNNAGANFVVSVSPDNNSLMVANHYKEDGSQAGNGLSITYKTKAGWSVPKAMNIRNYYNKDRYVGYFLCSDNKTLILSVRRDDSRGQKDLYVSFLKEDQTWSVPLNMGKTINTFENEANPFVAADGKTLYFASKGHSGYGAHDIFVCKRLDDTWTNWSSPKNLGPQVNSPKEDLSFYLTAKGDLAYLSSGGDIWSIENPEKPEPIILIKGRVFNAKTKQPMAVPIQYQNLSVATSSGTAKNLGIASSDPITGAYQIVLPAGAQYGYQAEKNGFYPLSNFIDLVDLTDYKEQTVDLYLTPIERGKEVRLNNLFFEFDKAVLKSSSYAELNRLAKVLKATKASSIEIGGHTDDKGTSTYNLELSKQRAAAVVAYLIGEGVDAGRLKAIGYGETKPLVKNSSEENRAINRRVEFKIR
jgi:outer membrane protein OmpA-like peptidoglycan-associated protein